MYSMILFCVAATAPAPTINDVSWLSGRWVNDPSERSTFEEQWTAQANGGMMGMFRLASNGRVVVYEFQLIEADAEGVWLRLRHYGPKMEDRDTQPAKLKLSEALEQKLVFANQDGKQPKEIVHLREAKDRLTVTVHTERNGQPTQLKLRFVRPAEAKSGSER